MPASIPSPPHVVVSNLGWRSEGGGRKKTKTKRTVRNCYPKFFDIFTPISVGDKDTKDVLIHKKGPKKEFSLHAQYRCAAKLQGTAFPGE